MQNHAAGALCNLHASCCKTIDSKYDLKPNFVSVIEVYESRLSSCTTIVHKVCRISYQLRLYIILGSSSMCMYSSPIGIFSDIKYAGLAYIASWVTN